MSQKRTGSDGFVNNGRENHLFDSKMNKTFAKFAKMSDNYQKERNLSPEDGKMTRRRGPAQVNPVRGAVKRTGYCIDNHALL